MIFGVLKKPLLPQDPPPVDGWELRVDCFETIELEEIRAFLESSPLPVILTLRATAGGGHFEGGEENRYGLLRQLAALEPAYIDLEYDTPVTVVREIISKHPAVKLICSYHNFEETPLDLDLLLTSIISRFPAHFYKIATFAKTTLDALRMVIFVQSRQNLIGVAMGQEGTITRVLGPVVGSPIDYASMGDPSAQGQLDCSTYFDTYRYRSLNRETQLYGLIGDPVEESIGHTAHNEMMKKYGINGVYVKMRVRKEELPQFFHLIKQLPFRGLSVTMPLKEAVVPYLTENRFPMPAVNTLLIEEGKIYGYNTDGEGAIDPIESHLLLKGKRVVLIGAGGAAKAIAFTAGQRGAQVVVLNRTAEKATALYGENGGGLERLEQEFKRGYDVIINTTPDPLPINPDWLCRGVIAMDIKSRPRITPFLAKALEKQCLVVYGLEMFIYQAVAQNQLWFAPFASSLAMRAHLYTIDLLPNY